MSDQREWELCLPSLEVEYWELTPKKTMLPNVNATNRTHSNPRHFLPSKALTFNSCSIFLDTKVFKLTLFHCSIHCLQHFQFIEL